MLLGAGLDWWRQMLGSGWAALEEIAMHTFDKDDLGEGLRPGDAAAQREAEDMAAGTGLTFPFPMSPMPAEDEPPVGGVGFIPGSGAPPRAA